MTWAVGIPCAVWYSDSRNEKNTPATAAATLHRPRAAVNRWLHLLCARVTISMAGSARPTFPLLGLLYVISVCAAALVQAEPVTECNSMEPVLCSRHTQDVRVICDMSAFEEEAPKSRGLTNYLQIIQNVSGETDVFASLDIVKGSVSSSPQLERAYTFDLRGYRDVSAADNDSWLDLSVADVQVPAGLNLSFYCRVIYRGSNSNELWNSSAVSVNPDNHSQPPTRLKGIRVIKNQGLSLECDRKTSVSKPPSEPTKILSFCQNCDQANDSTKIVSGCRRVHLFDLKCHDEGKYQSENSSTTDMELFYHIEFHLPDCATNHTTITACTSPCRCNETEDNCWKNAFIGVSVALAVSLIANFFLVLCRSKCPSPPQDSTQPLSEDDGSSLRTETRENGDDTEPSESTELTPPLNWT